MNFKIGGMSEQERTRLEEKAADITRCLDELRRLLEVNMESGVECSHAHEGFTKVVIECQNDCAVKVYRTEDGIILACKDEEDTTRCILTYDEAKSVANLLVNVACQEVPIQSE